MWPIFLFAPFCVECSVRFAAKSFNEAYAGWSKKSLGFVLVYNWFLIVSTENWLLIFYVFWNQKTKTNNFSVYCFQIWFQMIPNDLFYSKLYVNLVGVWEQIVISPGWPIPIDIMFSSVSVLFVRFPVCRVRTLITLSSLMLCCCFCKLVKFEVMQTFRYPLGSRILML